MCSVIFPRRYRFFLFFVTPTIFIEEEVTPEEKCSSVILLYDIEQKYASSKDRQLGDERREAPFHGNDPFPVANRTYSNTVAIFGIWKNNRIPCRPKDICSRANDTAFRSLKWKLHLPRNKIKPKQRGSMLARFPLLKVDGCLIEAADVFICQHDTICVYLRLVEPARIRRIDPV